MRRQAAGFTLAEVMVGVVVISIACLGLIGVQIFALKAGTVNRQQHLASVIASSLMAHRERTNRLDQEAFETDLHRGKTAVDEQVGYFYALDEQAVAPGLKEIKVTVFYKQSHETRDIDQTYGLRTLVYYGQ